MAKNQVFGLRPDGIGVQAAAGRWLGLGRISVQLQVALVSLWRDEALTANPDIPSNASLWTRGDIFAASTSSPAKRAIQSPTLEVSVLQP